MSKKNHQGANSIEMSFNSILNTRLWVYTFLSHGFYYELFPFLNSISTNNPLLKLKELLPGIDLITTFIDGVSEMSKEDLQISKEEHQRLFIGPGPLPAIPWESVYLGTDQIIFDKHTLAVRDFYKEWKMEVINLNKEPDDHMGIELAFIATMIKNSLLSNSFNDSSSLLNNLRAQLEFLDCHLLQWVDRYCAALSQSTCHDFYKGISQFTPHFLTYDASLIKHLISWLKHET